jgi:hypothetical protein
MHRYLAIVLAVSISSTAIGEEIPLKSIWAMDMPGTQSLNALDDGQSRGFLVEPIAKTLKSVEKPDSGFSVTGSGLSALRAVYNIRVGGEEIPQTLPDNEEISLVFFSYLFQPAVEVRSVVRKENEFTICYRFRPREELGLNSNLALIPVGELKPGKYAVKIERAPMADKFAKVGFRPVPQEAADKVICRSFEFTVE